MNLEPAVVQARRAHSSRCRQRVIKALDNAIASGEEITLSAIARQALLTELCLEFQQFSG